MKVLRVLVLVCLAACFVTAAGASDIDFGSYARSVAMGGAGLALADQASEAAVTNPAAPAASGTKLQFIFPSFDLDTRGTTIDELRNRTNEIGNSNQDDAIKLAEDFGSHTTKLTASFVTGIAGGLTVTANGEAQGIINPGANFRAWVAAGHPTTLAGLQTAGLVADAGALTSYAAALTTGTTVSGLMVYSAPTIGYGTKLNTRGGNLWVGGNMKFLRSDVRTWDIAATADTDANTVGLTANDLGSVKDNGVGMDLGFIYQPTKSKVQYGMVVNNFVEPKLKGIEAPAVWSVGAATKINKITVAMDMVNITKAGPIRSGIRTGFEWQPVRKLAVRAGYSGNAFTWGVGLIGLNFAFTNNAPTMLSKALAF